jgi:phosphotransferase system enzyme I (PtsP)
MQVHPGTAAPRRLLKRIRDLMAAGGSGQERLNQIVKFIASDMVAEVCSIYLVRGGEQLELFATEGLKQEAVHKTRLAMGEGLVGDIAAHARPLALADAQSHANFAYRPETGEEIYHSLMGVPILRGGRTLGVVVVQNRTFREYTEEEIETLQTIAMVLAELVAGGLNVAAGAGDLGPAPTALGTMRLDGLRLSDGIAVGRAVLHQPRITIRQMVAENIDAELKRLADAVSSMHLALDAMIERTDFADSEQREVLESYRMFAEDHGWLTRIREAVESGLTAEAAVQKVQEDTRARMSQIADPYLRERLADLEDLGNRLLQHLLGDWTAAEELPEEAVIVARNLGPAELLDYDRKKLRAVLLEEGSPTSHVAIIAQALDLPVLGRVRDVLAKIDPGDTIIVNAEQSHAILRPSEDVRDAMASAIQARAIRQASYEGLRDQPAVTRDGVNISLNLNAGLLIELDHLAATGAEGVGLYRTEIPFMIRTSFPDVEAQVDIYRRVLDKAAGKPVVFRTLDIGGDKHLPYLEESLDENPAMGYRAIRLALDKPLMLREQLRAMLRAAAGRRLDVMFPMVAEVAEFDEARALLELELERERRRGRPIPETLRVGTMIEVPALFWQLSALCERVDFLSVGSNDLLQFLFASDRGNPQLADRYDALSPPVLSFLAALAEQSAALNKPLTLCGDMASKPLEAMTLVGLGFRSLSMPAAAIGPVKEMVRRLELAPLGRYVKGLMRLPDHSVREKLRVYAQDHGVLS